MTTSTWVPIRDGIVKYATFGAKFVFPILGTIAPLVGLPAWVGVFSASIVPDLIDIAEENNPAPGSGAIKKAQVLNTLDEIMEILAKNFKGGALENFDRLRPTISLLINQTVDGVNELAKGIIADDPVDPGNAPVDTP